MLKLLADSGGHNLETETRWRVSAASMADQADTRELPPWRTIWFSPRRTIRRLLDTEPAPDWMPLAGLYLGVLCLSVVNTWLQFPSTTGADLIRLFALALAMWMTWLGPGMALLARYGRLRGGNGTTQQLRLAAVWCNVPVIVGGLCLIPLWISTGGAGFRLTRDELQPVIPTVLYLLTELSGYWTAILYIVAVAEVHQFSKWRAFESVTVIGILTFICYAVLVVIMKAVQTQIALLAL